MAWSHNSLSQTAAPKRLLLLCGLLVGFALRLFHLGGESLWYDETVSVVLATKSIPELIAHTAGDIHPPGYYLLLHGWQALTHPTLAHGLEFLVAWPSLVAGMLVTVLLYALGRRLAGAAVAGLALWLAAFNPFQVWYSQEVRMYTLGATLGLLCLYALVQYLSSSAPAAPINLTSSIDSMAVGRRWLILYSLAGAAGLYTLYYGLFWLVTLNLIALLCFWQRAKERLATPWTQLAAWGVAQLVLLLLWLPWLPIFLRQASEPPVPAWRTPWPNVAAFAQNLSASLSALLLGQSPPGQITWPWALLTAAVLGLYVKQQIASVTKRDSAAWRTAWVAPLATFVPITLIYLVTLLGTPLYHIRYLFLYASPFLLILASVLLHLRRTLPKLAMAAGLALFALNGLALQQFWGNPLYRSDDHRGAVAFLAQAWRPGDLILVNAGWAYTILQTYWPNEYSSPMAALPPALARKARLNGDAKPAEQPVATEPVMVVTGSVDGAATLGWGDPNRDFFAMSAEETVASLVRYAHSHRRIWHYRLYDTVSDPSGVIRTWLADHATLAGEWAIAGRDLGLLQQYAVRDTALQAASADSLLAPGYVFLATDNPFAEVVRLVKIDFARSQMAGSILYVGSEWQALPDIRRISGDLSLSLRLYARDGALLAQQDAAAALPTSQWQPDQLAQVSLAVPIAVSAKPGDYTLVLVLYAAQSGQTLLAPAARPSAELVHIGVIALTPALQGPDSYTVVARFDYLDLVAIQPATAMLQPGGQLLLNLVWHPRPHPYTDTYVALFELRSQSSHQILQQWEEALGGWDYPSAGWPAGLPVWDPHQLTLAPETPPGVYDLTLRVLRNSDRQTILAHGGWGRSQDSLLLSEITLQ